MALMVVAVVMMGGDSSDGGGGDGLLVVMVVAYPLLVSAFIELHHTTEVLAPRKKKVGETHAE